jgi:hypothetical protein
MARISARLLLLAGPVLLVVLAVSTWQDPAHLFDRKPIAARIASILLQNENVAGITDFDERLVQRNYARGLVHPRSIVVLGSSRVMQFREVMFPGHTLYNAAVSGATIEDLLAIYEILRERSLVPRRVILGLDPWMLNRNNGQVRWRALATDYARFAKGASLPSPAWPAWLELPPYMEALQPGYFQESLRQLARAILKGQPQSGSVRATTATEDEGMLKLRDGSIVYSRDFRERSQESIDESARMFTRAPVYSLEGFSELDAGLAWAWETLIEAMRSDGVEVTIVLAPFHPHAYATLLASGRYSMLAQSEREFCRIAREKSMPVVGSFDPSAVGATSRDFLDGMHSRAAFLERMLVTLDSKPK